MDGRPAPTMTSRSGCVLGNASVISQQALSAPVASSMGRGSRCRVASVRLKHWADQPCQPLERSRERVTARAGVISAADAAGHDSIADRGS